MLFLQFSFLADLCKFLIKFRSHQHGESGPVQPDHQSDGGSQRSIGFVEVPEMAKVNTQQIGQTDPATHRNHCARQRCPEALLEVRCEEVKSLNRKDRESDGYGPVDVRPEQHKESREVNSAGEP